MKSLVNFARAIRLLQVFTLIAAASVIVACQSNPIAHAKSVEQKAYALYGTFVVFEEQGAALIVQQATPEAVRRAIRQADAKAKPIADNLLRSARQYLLVKQQLEAGKTTDDRLIIATQNLEKWVNESTPVIQELIKAVGGK